MVLKRLLSKTRPTEAGRVEAFAPRVPAPAGDPFNPVEVLAVGTTNKCKIAAVEAVLQDYEKSGTAFLAGAAIEGHKVLSEVSEQPMTLEETYRGAMNRARNAYEKASAGHSMANIMAVGLESGLNFSSVDGRAYDVCVCSIFDGTNFNQGMSCAFEIPPAILRYVVEEGMDLSQASNAAGVSSNPALGEAEGLIGILSRGRVTRLDYTKQAISMALLPFESDELFSRPEGAEGAPVPKPGARADGSAREGVVTPLRSMLGIKACSSSSNGLDVLRLEADRRDCTARLCSAARGRCGTEFELPLVALLAAFGTGDAGQPSHFTDCTHSVDASGCRTVVIDGESAVQAVLGDSPLSASIGRITLHHDGANTAKLSTERAKGQSSLAASLVNGSRPTAQSIAAAKAVEAAADSQQDPFLVESDDEMKPEAKRLRTQEE